MNLHVTNKISRLFGSFASYEFPRAIQNLINKSYVLFLRLDMSEYDGTSSYKSLNKLFTRELRVKREICQDGNVFISPSDGLISEQGEIKEHKSFQIKGKSYDVKKLLGEYIKKEDKLKLENGKFVNIYLSPKDYHRYHSPCDMRILKAVQICGKLYPVNFKYLNKVPSLFCENERVILVCESEKFGRFYLVFVGALNVGKIKFLFDERIDTNAKEGMDRFYEYEDLTFYKGDELGRFEMGSTIVVLFENENIIFEKELEKLKFGEKLVKI